MMRKIDADLSAAAPRSATQRRTFHRQLWFERLEGRRLLANVTVSNLSDIVNGTTTSIAALVASPGADGISLREAVLAANADAAADVIDFGSLTGTVQLTNTGHVGEIAITNALSINGPGAKALTVKAFAGTATAGDGARIFNVDDGNSSADKTVTISGLTLTGGDVAGNGGAIRSKESLSVTACTISGNSVGSSTVQSYGGGIANVAGNLTVTLSTITGNATVGSVGGGGGIYSTSGNLTVDRSTISGNTTSNMSYGGGIRSSYTSTTITASTISGNSAQTGGGIMKNGASQIMTITDSTISGNSARLNGGGVDAIIGTVNLLHSTITGNRADSDNNATGNAGGVLTNTFSHVTLDHTIVAGNFRSASTRDDISGTLAARYSLIGDNTSATITNNGGNQIGTSASPIDPKLGPLLPNGGPTLTHALLPGSPAIDAGDPAAVAGSGTVPLQDQRGSPFGRIADGDGAGGARIDIGAYERQAVPGLNPIVDTLADESDGNYSAGNLSLREAIDLANGSTGNETITFAATLTSGSPATILLTQGELDIRDALTIQGPGATLLTVDSSGSDPTPTSTRGDGARALNINDGSATSLLSIQVAGLTITGGDISNDGGGIRNAESLTITNCKIYGNTAANGGGVANFGDLTIRASTISGNQCFSQGVGTDGDGGGIFNEGSLTVIDSTISGNTTSLYGGGIYSRGPLTVVNSTISSNRTTFNTIGIGGGVYFASISTVLTVRHSTIAGNDAHSVGGIASNSTVVLDHTIVAGNGSDDFSAPALSASFSQINIGANFLGPLQDNGGPTFTNALLPGSPAIDAGDPTAVAGVGTVPQFDQRGFPYTRVIDRDGAGGSRIDIGAFEFHPTTPNPPNPSGDYNRSGQVEASDYVLWRKTLGTGGLAAFAGADGSGNGQVGVEDYGIWRAHFGQTAAAGAGGEAGHVSSVEGKLSSAGATATSSTEADRVDEVRVLSQNNLLPTRTNAVIERAGRLVALEAPMSRQDPSSRSRGPIHRFGVAGSGSDDLLLLAIDRVGRAVRPHVPTSANVECIDLHVAVALEPSSVDAAFSHALGKWQLECGDANMARI